ncbi:ras GTPase [Purpureocillium lilacinum]|uniref:Ras GTPase n=1 Tax=Purpureocillium lilacinum TaxID=33203 RepID=A0A179FIY7_PURLI|nr:ras GTPase [Purpureocillium lilacinum]OAQ65605.1 ras GTPase [Purpureocillium lilacinum]
MTTIVLIGDSGVGKSNILGQYLRHGYVQDFNPTIGVNFAVKTVQVGSQATKVHIWDTAGREQYRMPTNYYHGAVGVMLVYDITNHTSYESMARWLHEIRRHADAGIIMTLVGNKMDLANRRTVPAEVAKSFNDLFYIETSALNGTNVEIAFRSTLVKGG